MERASAYLGTACGLLHREPENQIARLFQHGLVHAIARARKALGGVNKAVARFEQAAQALVRLKVFHEEVIRAWIAILPVGRINESPKNCRGAPQGHRTELTAINNSNLIFRPVPRFLLSATPCR